MAGRKGRSGRKKTPTALVSEATQRKRTGEPKPEGRITQPRWLDADAKRIWSQALPIVESMRVMTAADVTALARYCAYLARWRRLMRDLGKRGEIDTIETERGQYRQQAAEVGIINKLEQMITKLETQFGLTPASRAGLRVEPEPQKTETKADKFGLVG